MAKLGYARVSAEDQDFGGQVDRLKAAGCDRIYAEKASGQSTNGRPELARLIKALQPGDTVIVIRIDRFARSIHDLLSLWTKLRAPVPDSFLLMKPGATRRALRATCSSPSWAGLPSLSGL
jgi:DNA invertase Pin-like site-specific DNA recombinase